LFAKKGLDFWSDPGKPLKDLFRDQDAGSLADCVEELSHMQVPASDCFWPEVPAAYLLDYLTQEHRETFFNCVTDIQYLLDLQSLADPESVEEIRSLQRDFRRFTQELDAVTDIEETQVFPRILRYEACLRDPRVHPEFQRGSLHIAIANRMSRFSVRRQRVFQDFLNRVRKAEGASPNHPGMPHLAQRLDEFRQGLSAHEELEFETLFPMALEMERTLYNLSIEGAHAPSQRVRGPMDSGIMRLRTR
jgi:iron-sulfur cluster repair protein YtfE (RIC family)